jgi:predicted deacylase
VAPQGGIVTWDLAPGAMVVMGQTIGHVCDPTTGQTDPVLAPIEGMLFRQELWRSCLRGQDIAHVAGAVAVREGDLLSD